MRSFCTDAARARAGVADQRARQRKQRHTDNGIRCAEGPQSGRRFGIRIGLSAESEGEKGLDRSPRQTMHVCNRSSGPRMWTRVSRFDTTFPLCWGPPSAGRKHEGPHVAGALLLFPGSTPSVSICTTPFFTRSAESLGAQAWARSS